MKPAIRKVQVGPLEDYDTATFTVLAYDRVNFTTARSSFANPPATPLPPISTVSVDPATGDVTLTWPAPDGVTDPASLTESLERTTTLDGEWTALPDAATTVTEGIATFNDPSPPDGAAFYRVVRP